MQIENCPRTVQSVPFQPNRPDEIDRNSLEESAFNQPMNIPQDAPQPLDQHRVNSVENIDHSQQVDQATQQVEQTKSSIFNHLASISESVNRITAKFRQLEPKFLYLAPLPVCAFAALYRLHTVNFLEQKFDNQSAQMPDGLLKQVEQIMLPSKLIDDHTLNPLDLAKTLFNRISEQINQLEPKVLQLIPPAHTAYLNFVIAISASLFICSQFKNQSKQIKNLEVKEKEHFELTQNLRQQIEILKDELETRAEKEILDNALKENIDVAHHYAATLKRLRPLIMNTKSKTDALEKGISELSANLQNSQATQSQRIENLERESTLRKDEISQLTDGLRESSSGIEKIRGVEAEILRQSEEIDDLQKLCQLMGGIVQNLITHLPKESEATPIVQNMSNVLDARWLSQLVERMSKSDWGSWEGSQQSSSSRGPLTGSPPPSQ
ncbi:MAG: hypothetical protein ON057_000639 [Glomeribacter sp. 1016415]|nr:hypothetical protein [Glomeribacter sp. 1016415]